MFNRRFKVINPLLDRIYMLTRELQICEAQLHQLRCATDFRESFALRRR